MPWRKQKKKKKKKKGFDRSPHSCVILSAPSKVQEWTDPAIQTDYVVRISLPLRSRAIAVRNQRGYQPRSACNYKQYKVGRGPFQFQFSIQIHFHHARTPDYHRWPHVDAKEYGEGIEPWCRMYLRKKKLKPMAMASIESV